MATVVTQATLATETVSPGTALVRHAPQISGTVQGSVQQMLGESVSIPGGGTISDELLVPGTPALNLNGKPAFGGTITGTGSTSPSGYEVTLNGQTRLGHLVTRTNPVALRAVSAPSNPTGTRDLTVNSAGQSVSSWTTIRNLTLNGNAGQYAVPPGTYGDFSASSGSGFTVGVAGSTQPAIYEFQHLTLNARSRLEVIGPVVIKVKFDLIESGQAGTSTNPSWLEVQVANGGVTLNGGSSLSGYVFAPSGSVTINGGAALNGGLECDRLTLNGRGLLRLWVRSGGGGNQPPVADNQTVEVIEDTPTPVTLTAVDPDNGTLTYTITGQPQHGTLSGSAPNLTYTPALNSNDADSFAFTVSDGQATSAPATVSISVTPVNDAPVATPQSVQTNEDIPLPLTLTGTDVDHDPLTVQSVTNPSHGIVELVNGTWVYTPASNYNGADSFTFTVFDGQLPSAPVVVRIEVTPVPDTPTATPRQVQVLEDSQVNIVFSGTDADGDALSFAVATNPSHGTLEVTADGVIYRPAENFDQAESFTYTASDGTTTSAPATVSITVVPVNDAPTAESGNSVTEEDTPVDIALVGHDVENSVLSYLPDALPVHGVLTRNGSVWTYTPDADYNGPDAFTFKVSDGELESAAAEIRIDVHGRNDAPIAHTQTVEVIEDTPQPISLTAEDVDQDVLAFEIVTQPAHGSLAANPQSADLNSYIYTPEPNFDRSDTFTFRVFDGTEWSAVATVIIHVEPRNDGPAMADSPESVPEDGVGTFILSGSDADGDALTYQIVSGPDHGVGAITGNRLTYVPTADYFGPDNVRVRVLDGNGGEAEATVSISVLPVNDAPMATGGTLPVLEDQFASVFLTGSDIDGDPLTYEIISGPEHGQVLGTAESPIYFPAPNYSGPDHITFVAKDGQATSAPAQIIIDVLPVNDRPVASPQEVETDEDTSHAFVLVGTDIEGDPLTYTVTAQPLHGTLTGTAPNLTYIPEFNYHGTDALMFKVSDGQLESNAVEVRFVIRPVNDAPVAQSQTVDATEDTPKLIALAGNDVDQDSLTYEIVTQPMHGTLAGSDRQWTYTPGINFDQTDAFTFRVFDGSVWSAPATVTIRVAPQNDPPSVDAGLDVNGTVGTALTLRGSVTDIDTDPSALVISWSKVSGPGAAGFVNANLAVTEAMFSAPGVYVLRLSAGDGEFTASDEVTVTIAPGNQPPVVNAGPDQFLAQPGMANLSGAVTDDGLPVGGSVHYAWSKISGPADVTFGTPRSLATVAAFTIPGTYVLRLSASDGQLAGSDELTINVAQPNAAPVVNAGVDAQTIMGQSFSVVGEVHDDGLPLGAGVSIFWHKVSGPGNAVFAAPGETTSAVTFGSAGTYVLRLEANDSALWAADDVSVTVAPRPNQAPVVNAGPDRSASGVRSVVLAGSATDDGLPEGSSLLVSWVKVSGPGNVTFSAQSSAATEASFSQPGVYVLRLSALDGELSAADDVAVTITFENQPPVVNAGPDLSATLGQPVHIQGAVSDDGLPEPATLTIGWSKVAGQGTATFSSVGAATTDVTFDQVGTYVLRLTANDSERSTSDEVTVTVTANPFTTWTYTTNADFDLGTLSNVDHSLADQLQLSDVAQPFNFIWVANSSKGTIVKIDTDTGKVLGEYWTSPNGQPRNPSRTTVDLNGNVWGTNRDGNSVVQIGLAEAGQWIDKNGNGRLDTSTGLNDLRPWTNANNADTNGGVSTAEDECVLHYTRVNSSGTRHVAVTRDNDIWVSGIGGRAFDLIDGKTGLIKRSEPTVNYGGYGGLIDRFGVIWSSRPLLRWDTSKPLTGPSGQNWTGYNHDSYGLAVGLDGNVWNTALEGNIIRKFSPDGTLIGTYQHGFYWAQGCCVDKLGHVWVAHSLNGGVDVGHLRGDGVFVGNVKVGAGPTGVAVDARGKIWAASYDGTVSRIDPNSGPLGADGVTRVGLVDLTTVNLGGQLYNYSDMTGSTLVGKPLSGTWTVIRDSGKSGNEWGGINWTGHVCDDGKITVTVASSESFTSFPQGQSVISGSALNVPNGRYLKITVLLQRSSAGESPILYDLTVGTKQYVPTAVANATPTVSAGEDQDVPWPTPVNLRGNVCDDDLPAGAGRTVQWSKLNGPGLATFASPQSLVTSVTFSEPGVYILRMDGSDSQASDYATVRITSLPPNAAPVVDAGLDTSAPGGTAVTLRGWVSDDGLPDGSVLTSTWSVLYGPGTVAFANPASPATTATFSTPGIYVLKLSATDGALTVSDVAEVRIDTPCTIDPPDGAVAWWPGNGSGRDMIGGHDGSLVGGVGFAPGKVATGFQFDGMNDFIQVPASPSLNVGAGAGMTVEFWIQPNDPNRWQEIIEWNGGGLNARGAHIYVEGIYQGGRLWVNLIDSNGAGHSFMSNPGLLKSGELQHVAVTYEKATGWLRIYRNGGLFQEGLIGTFTPRTTSDVYIAHIPGDGFFAGILDEVTVYGRALTSEIGEIYQAGVAGKCAPGGNHHPVVDAGPDRSAPVNVPVALQGLISDDGLPAGAPLTARWTVLDGPGNVQFSDAQSAATSATFGTPGIYVLRLTGSDTLTFASDSVQVRVGQACSVEAPDDMAAWWPGNGTGEDLVSGNNAVALHGASFGPGKVSLAFSFDGADDAYRVAASPALDVGSSDGMTVEFWLKPNNPNAWQPLIEWNNGTAFGAHIWIEGTYQGGRIWVNLVDTAGTHHAFMSAPGFLQANVWQHLAVTYDKLRGLLRVWRNGALFQEVFLGRFTPRTNYDLYFARRPGDGSRFGGAIDEISFYRRVLDAELTSIFEAGAIGKCPLDANEPPTVDAGPDRSVMASGVNVALSGRVADDGLPLGSAVTSQWSVVNGPGTVTFADAGAPVTTARFSAPGIYVLRLIADDSLHAASDTMEVRVGSSCMVEPPSGLMAWWPGNGDAREVVKGNDGQMLSGVGTSTGKVSLAWNFDGVDDAIKVPAAPEIDVGLQSGFTIEFWFNPVERDRWQPIVEWNGGNPGPRGGHLWIEGTYQGGRLWVNFIDRSGIDHTFRSEAGLFQANTWTHLAVTYNKSDGLLRVFRNGEVFQEVALGSFSLQSSYDLYVGQTPSDANRFHGQIDELSLYNRPLTSEVAAIYAAGAVGKCPLSGNQAPFVDAGPDLEVAQAGQPVTLSGFVSDDGLPLPAVAPNWTLVQGPGTATFADASSPSTTVTFSAPGIYVLRLTADDSEKSATDQMEVRVAPSCQEPAASAVAWWPGNGDSRDVLGGHDGELISGVGFAPGKVGLAYSFDGVNDQVHVPKDPALNVGTGNGITAEFWINPVDANRWQPILGWYNGTTTATNGVHVWVEGTYQGGRLWISLVDTSGVAHEFRSEVGLIASNTWRHIAVVYNKAAAQLSVYRDGTLFQQVPFGTFTPQTTYDFYLGYRPTDASRFRGLLDEITLYNAPLTGPQIAAIAALGSAGKCPPPRPNQAPYVFAGHTQQVPLGQVVTLHGVAYDDDQRNGGILALQWSQVSGPGSASFTAPTNAETSVQLPLPGSYVFRLTANDGSLASSSDVAVAVTTGAGNLAPIVRAGDAQVIRLPAVANLAGSASDDGLLGPLAIRWRAISGPGTVQFADPGSAETTASFSAPGSYQLRLTADDGQYRSASDVSVTVQPAAPNNRAPVVYAGPDQPAYMSTPTVVKGAASDDGLPLGSTLAMQWSLVSGPGTISFVDPHQLTSGIEFSLPGAYVLRLTVSDSDASASDEVTFNVYPAFNQAPVVEAGPDQQVSISDGALLTGSVTDDGMPLGQTLTTRWRKVSGPGAVSFSSEGTGTRAQFGATGTYTLELIADDTEKRGSDWLTVVVGSAHNQPPVASAGQDQTIPIDSSATITPVLQDDGLPNGYFTVSWKVISGPGDVHLERDGDEIHATFGAVGTYVLRLIASDTEFTTADDVQILVTPGANAAPTVTLTSPAPGASVVPGQPEVLSASAADAEGELVGVEFYVDGQFVDSDSESPFAVSWIPNQAGPHSIIAVAIDAIGQQTSTAPVTVNAVVRPPAVRLTAPLDGAGFNPGATVAIAATASSSVGITKVEFYIDGSLIATSVSAPYSGSWVAPNGVHQITAMALANDGQSNSAQATVYVETAPPEAPWVEIVSPENGDGVTAPTPVSGIVDSPALRNWTLDYRRVHDDCFAWTTVATGTAPVGSADPRTTAALGTFDPTLLQNGIYEFRLRASDRFGRQAEATSTVFVDGDMKVGEFRFSTKDITIDLPGLSLEVNRIYSTLKHCEDDFGPGWALDLRAVRLVKNHSLGEGWTYDVFIPEEFLIPPTYSLIDDGPHLITVTFPTGESYRFRPVLTIKNRPAFPKLDRYGNVIGQDYAYLYYADPLKIVYQPLRGSEGMRLVPHGYKAIDPWDGTRSTVAADADFFLSDPYMGSIRLCTRDNVAQDSPEMIDATGFDLVMPDGRTYTFDANGTFTKLTDRSGQFVEARENGFFHSNGQSVTWERDALNHNRITKVIDPQGEAVNYSYNPGGGLAKVTDRTGNTTRFEYDVPGRLVKILDPLGNAVQTNTYSDTGRLASTTDAAGNVTSFDHDLDGRVEVVTRDGRTVTVRYDELGHVIEKIDAAGVRSTYTYAVLPDGSMTDWRSSETVWARLPSADGSTLNPAVPVTTRYFYDDDDPATPPKTDGLLRKIVDPEGHAIRLAYSDDTTPETGRSVVPREVLSMADARETARAQAEGRATHPTAAFGYYDVRTIGGMANPLFGLQRSITDASGNTTFFTYHGNIAERGSLGQIKAIDRQVTSFDANGNPVTQLSHTAFEYDYYGFVSHVTTPLGYAFDYSHDLLGQTLQQTQVRTLFDRNGNSAGAETLVTSHAYDASGHLTREWRPDRPRTNATETWTDGDGQGPSRETVYNERGKPAVIYDSAGAATSYEYNTRGLLTKTSYPDGTSEEILYDAMARKEYERNRQGIWSRHYYDADGRETRTNLLGANRVTTPGAGVTLQEIAYDDLGHVWRKTDGEGNTTAFVWDKAGRPLRQINARHEMLDFAWDENGNLLGAGDPSDPSRTIAYAYDAQNRRTDTIYPVSDVTINGAVHSVATERRAEFDELGRRVAEYETSPVGTALSERGVRRFQYDIENRLTGVRDAAGKMTSWAYDEAGNRVGQTDAAGHTTHYVYDSAGRRLARVLPGGETESRNYDTAGRLTNVTVAGGQTITNSYDPVGRVSQRITTTNGTSDVVTFGYDPASGLRTSTTDATGQTTYQYDDRGRLKEKHTPLGPSVGTTLYYDWNEAGKVASIRSSTPGGVDLRYQYDELNRLESVADGLRQIMAYSYDSHGNLATATAGNGMNQQFGFDALNRLRSMSVTSPAQALSASEPIASYSYSLNSAGQRTSVTELDGRTVNYEYDALRRLTSESVVGNVPDDGQPGLNGAISYTYDAVGNRLARTVTGLLSKVVPSVPAYQYSPSDNLTNAASLPATDPVTVEPVGGHMVLDADGNLVRKIVGTGTSAVVTDYLVAEHNPTGYSQVVEEFTNGALSCAYDWGLKQIDQRRTGTGGTAETRYFVHDGSGNVRGLADETGHLTDRYDYDSFGNSVGQWVYGDHEPTENEYRFAGERFDAQARLIHLRARFYEPATGRMVGEDPFEGNLRQPVSLHRYAYAQNDPVNLSDPSGANPTLAVIMMQVNGIDPITQAQFESRTAGQFATIEANKALVRTVGAYLRKLQQRNNSDADDDPTDEGDDVPDLTGQPGRVWSNQRNDLDQLVPQNLYDIAQRDLAGGKIGSGLFNAVDLVMNLTEGKGATIGQILGALNNSEEFFGAHWSKPFLGEYASAGLTHTASNPGLNMTVTEFYSPPHAEAEEIEAIDTIPPRFMRVALNGRPVPDAPPTMDAETDQKPVETYIHAGYLQLRHEVSDISIPLPGGELNLGVRRNFEGINWSEGSQINPEKLPDQPFGGGWNSNLSACIRFSYRTTPVSPAQVVELPDGSKELVGGSPLWGNYAYVRDETGAEYRFAILYQGTQEMFLPMPTSRQDIDVAQFKLEHVGGNQYVFTRKFGTKLFFNRMRDGQGGDLIRHRIKDEQWSYARLTEIRDRFETRVVHEYSAPDKLLPFRIRGVTPLSDRAIDITYNLDGKVETVTDPRGEVHQYGYSDVSYVARYEERQIPVLTSVLAPKAEAASTEQAETRYSYDLDDDETRLSVQTYGFDPDSEVYYHLDLKGLRDPRGNNYWFNYSYDHSRLNYWKEYANRPQKGSGQLPPGVLTLRQGYYPKKGQKRTISSVVFPNLVEGGEPIVSRFYNYSRVYSDSAQQRWAGNGDLARRLASVAATRRLTVIQDTEGNQRIYDFDRFQYVPLATFEPKMLPQPHEDLTNVRTFVPYLYEFVHANIVHLDHDSSLLIDMSGKRVGYSVSNATGTESITYNPDAGLEVCEIVDFCGNKVSFEYGDEWAYPAAAELGVAFPFQRRRDPTLRTRSGASLPQPLVRKFSYTSGPTEPSWRVLTDMVDEEGRETVYHVNNLGQTVVQEVLSQLNGPLVQRTKFTYDSALPSFLSRREVERGTGDPSWATSLVTDFVPDALTGLVGTQVVDSGGLALTTSTTYDANGNRTSVTDPRGATTRFAYDALNQLVQVEYPQTDLDAASRRQDFFYDLCGNKTLEQDENGVITEYGYDNWNRLVQTTRQMGSGGSGDANITTRIGYNLVDSVIAKQDARGAVTSYKYDGLQRLIETRSPMVTGAGAQYVTRFSYDPARNTGASGMRPGSFQPTTVIDPRGYSTLITYDGAYRKVKEEHQYADQKFTRIDSHYDRVGNVLTTDVARDGATLTSETQYDALNRPVKQIQPDENFSTVQYTATGLAWRATDERGFATETEYDSAGRPIIVRDAAVPIGGGGSGRPTSYTYYDENGNIVGKSRPHAGTAAYGSFSADELWQTTYDARNRKRFEVEPRVWDSSANAWVRPTTESRYDGVGNVVAVIDAGGNKTDTVYDRAYRPVQVLAPAVNVLAANGSTASIRPTTTTQYDPNGNAVLVTDANAHQTVNEYDELNRLIASQDGAGNVVHFGYDGSGNKTKVLDGKANPTRFEFDGLNRVTSEIDASNQATVYTYDEVNRRTSTDAGGRQILYSYDLRNRVQSETYVGRAQDNRTYAYDATGNLLSVDEAGTTRDVTYIYDALDRLTSETSQGVTHQYGYDLAGNMTHVTYGGTGRQVVHAYDAGNQLTSLTESGRTTSYGYDVRGLEVRQTLPNGDRITVSHDALGRETSRVGRNGGGGELYSYTMAHNATGNVRRIDESYAAQPALNRMVTNQYDGANRLRYETVTGANAETTEYQYDAANNRTARIVSGGSRPGTTTYGYNVLNQLVSESGTRSAIYNYDADGNRIARVITGSSGMETTLYAYDYDNRLVQWQGTVEGQPSTFNYEYDYRSRRVNRTENGATTSVVFSGGLSVQEYNQPSPLNAQPSVEYLRGSDLGGGIGGLLYSLRSDGASYSHANARGDVTTKTNSAGALTWQASYEAFGTRTAEVGTTNDRQKANTKEEDPSGLLNEGMRYRDLETGTFLTRDPAGFVDGPNLYAYVVQNPWTSYDPDGLWVGADDAAAVGVGAALGVASQAVGDAVSGHLSSWQDYAAAAVGGAVAGEAALYTGGLASGAAGGAATNATRQGLNMLTGKQKDFDRASLAKETAVGAIGGVIGAKLGERFNCNGVLKATVGGATAGALTGAATQVASNAIEGKTGSALFEGIKQAAVTGAITGGVTAFGSAARNGCFVAGTLVACEKGLKPIEQVVVGDMVWCQDSTQPGPHLGKVVQTFRLEKPTLLITIGDEQIETTDEHPFWVVDGEDLQARAAALTDTRPTLEGRWVRAKDLRIEDRVVTIHGELQRIEGIQHTGALEYVYNFEVEGAHSYFVGEDKVLVHNMCGDGHEPEFLRDADLQAAADLIHGELDPIAARQRTTTVTQGFDSNGRPVHTVTNSAGELTRAQVNAAKLLLGDSVQLPQKSMRFRKMRLDPADHHGEAVGSRFTEGLSRRAQASSSDAAHGGKACPHCHALQQGFGIRNVTGVQ